MKKVNNKILNDIVQTRGYLDNQNMENDEFFHIVKRGKTKISPEIIIALAVELRQFRTKQPND